MVTLRRRGRTRLRPESSRACPRDRPPSLSYDPVEEPEAIGLHIQHLNADEDRFVVLVRNKPSNRSTDSRRRNIDRRVG